MKTRMTIMAALFGFAMFAAPITASAKGIPAWRRAFAAQRFQTMGPKARYHFMATHPFLAHHRWMLNNPGWQNRGFQQGYYGNQYGNAYNRPWAQGGPAYMNHEPDGDEYGAGQPYYPPQQWRGGDDDGDDGGGQYGGPGAYGYGAPVGYGYGSPYGYGPMGTMGSMLPMLQQFIP